MHNVQTSARAQPNSKPGPMALNIETFSNVKGGNCFFKAIGHPLIVDKARALFAGLAAQRSVALYDPLGMAAALAQFYDLRALASAGVYVQRIEDLGNVILDQAAQALDALPNSGATVVFVAAFDAQRLIDQIHHLLPAGARVVSLDELRLPDAVLSNTRRYLDPLNFATNLAFFRDAGGQHTRVVSSNYWHGWGMHNTQLWLCLFDSAGAVLAQWHEQLPDGNASVVIDSALVRRRFGLREFTGTLYIHAQHIGGHDIVKYALDTYGDTPSELSCTHDANAWPADLYAGLPAPRAHERVVLWIQNSHPIPIPAGAVGVNSMGASDIRCLDVAIPAFGTYALDIAALFPEARWPTQFEIHAGKYFVRPRYEITQQNGRRRIAHVNVERNDLQSDPKLATLGALLGKGYLLPAPILPVSAWHSLVLPTPMATDQLELPLAVKVFAADGSELLTHALGNLARHDSVALDVNALLTTAGRTLPSGYGHVELLYDFNAGQQADGWLHALFRYEQIASGHVAETSFGAHMFNMATTYKDEPQSYAGRPPGLSTRLFLRLGDAPLDTFCHLIYPSSTTWHALSATQLHLHDATGAEVATRELRIPCSGSLFWRYHEMFTAEERSRAGSNAYVVVRDLTCRLFGYHGLLHGKDAFCVDHMFGF